MRWLDIAESCLLQQLAVGFQSKIADTPVGCLYEPKAVCGSIAYVDYCRLGRCRTVPSLQRHPPWRNGRIQCATGLRPQSHQGDIVGGGAAARADRAYRPCLPTRVHGVCQLYAQAHSGAVGQIAWALPATLPADESPLILPQATPRSAPVSIYDTRAPAA